MKPKFGIIGCGQIARFHFKGLAKAGAQVVHVADLSESAARPYVQATGARYSVDYRALIADPEVTVVDILSHSKYHREMCLAALEAGKDVICEKTMTDNPAEAEEVARAAARAAETSGQLFFTAYMKRFFPAVRKAKDLLPTLGRLFSAQVRVYQAWGNLYEISDVTSRMSVFDRYGGAIIKCGASHMLDMTLNLLRRPQALYAHVDYVPGTRFDRKATALLEYPTGLVVSFEAATHPLMKVGYERNSWDECLQINGVGGRLDLYSVRWDHAENNAALLVHYDNRTETSTEYRFDALDPFDAEMQYLNDCLDRRVQGQPSALDGFNVDVLIGAIVESGDKRARVALDWRGL